MSRFVPAGANPDSQEKQPAQPVNDAWLKAQKLVEATKQPKKPADNTQDGGKSLYEVLQANKAAKQEAFEESAKLKNQFRALDDDEVDFLDSVLESSRAKEDAVRQETAEQLEVFRKQRAAAEQALAGDYVREEAPKDSWTTNKKKKRRREQEPEVSSESKTRKLSGESGVTTNKGAPTLRSVSIASSAHTDIIKDGAAPPEASSKSTPLGLSLAAYSSDEDD